MSLPDRLRLTGAHLRVVAVHKLAAKTLFDSELAAVSRALTVRRRWIIHQMEFPVIDCEFEHPEKQHLRVRFHCDDWNTLPPKIELLTPKGEPLIIVPGRKTGVFNASAHPVTGKPFICMRGSREYHTHKSHTADLWEPLRGQSSLSLGGILTQVWNAWLKEIS